MYQVRPPIPWCDNQPPHKLTMTTTSATSLTKIAPKACLAAGVLVTGWIAYKWLTKRPTDKFVEAIIAAGDDIELAEECLMNVTLSNDTLTSLTPMAHLVEEQEKFDAAVEDAYENARVEAVAQIRVAEALGKEEEGVESVTNTLYVEPRRVRVKRDELASANPVLEVRDSRIVIGKYRATYARRVLDACKSKFGCPEVTKANHRAVWRFAEQIMKDHGLRPSHRVELLPYVVQLCFVPSVQDRLGCDSKRSYDYYMGGQFEEHMSRFEVWTRKLKNLFWLE